MIGKLLGIDHGLRRIGVAVSDAIGISARELTILENSDDDYVFGMMCQIADEKQVVGIVVGYPSNEGNTEQADVVKDWVHKLENTIAIPVILWDEQLSSTDAKILARQLKRKPQTPIDDLAARVILQSYINAIADGLAKPPDMQ